jgi:hypothetical protein
MQNETGKHDQIIKIRSKPLKMGRTPPSILAAAVELIRAGFSSHKRKIAAWWEFDAVYQVWKKYRKGEIARQAALRLIGLNYGVARFFYLYPLYKILKPLRKASASLKKLLGKGPDLFQPATKRGRMSPLWFANCLPKFCSQQQREMN